RSTLDAELCALPEHLRLPLILCYLEGRTQDEAAAQLGWSKSTLRRRLDKARTVLGRRLRAQHVGWSARLSALLVSDCIASPAPVPALVASTLEFAGPTVTTAVSAEVAALTEGVLKAMLMSKIKNVTALVLVFVACASTALALVPRLSRPTRLSTKAM